MHWVYVLIFVCSFIWSHVSGLMRFLDRSDKGTASNYVQILEKRVAKILAMIRQAFGEESMSCRKSKHTETEKGETGEEQSQEHVHHFSLTSEGLFTKNSSWQAKHSLLHTIETFWGHSVA
jgi:plasmid maintenance system killer protein